MVTRFQLKIPDLKHFGANPILQGVFLQKYIDKNEIGHLFLSVFHFHRQFFSLFYFIVLIKIT